MVYQEQVMQIFNQLGGIELSAAYKLIKAISKKTTDVIAKYKPDFLKGAQEKGVDKKQAEDIFELILKFGGYGFNKSHSTRYAIIAFQTAFMKAYHPVEYMAAVLTFEMGSTDKVVEYIEECRRLTLPDGGQGIKVLPPDVNFSDKDFTPIYEEAAKKKRGAQPPATGVIRFGMMAVRGVGEKAVEAIIAERTARGDFKSIYDFCERVDLRQVSRATSEALVKCGAFASTGSNRAQALAALEGAIEMGQQSQQDKRAGQMNMFAAPESTGSSRTANHALPQVEELADAELLKMEKELLGFYITSHPLTEHLSALEHFSTVSTKEAMACAENADVLIGGMINSVKTMITKNGKSAGQKMARITLEDLEGQIDGMLFADTLAKVLKQSPGLVAKEQIVFLRGKVDRLRETPSIVVNDLIPIAEAAAKLTTMVALKLDSTRHAADVTTALDQTLQRHKGQVDVFLQVASGGRKVTMKLSKDRSLRPTQALADELHTLLGSDCVQFCGQGTRRRKKIVQQPLFQATEQPSEATARVDPLPEGDPLLEEEMAMTD